MKLLQAFMSAYLRERFLFSGVNAQQREAGSRTPGRLRSGAAPRHSSASQAGETQFLHQHVVVSLVFILAGMIVIAHHCLNLCFVLLLGLFVVCLSPGPSASKSRVAVLL